jgi:lysylphosphatidylglycerol synthetase-like protein (DUF2156 family)
LALEPRLQVHTDVSGILGYEVRGSTVFGIGGLNTGDIVELLGSFVASAGKGARRHLLFPVREAERGAVHEAGFRTLQVGVEGWLDLPGLTWSGRRFQHVRHLRNKAVRLGVVCEEVHPDAVSEELRAIHKDWLASKRPSWRMKLLVGSPGLDRPGDRRYVVARSEHRVEAFLTLLPGAPGQWGVDVMCRRPDGAKGTMEHLILHAASLLQEEGATALSLGPCPMADVLTPGTLGGLFRVLYHSGWGNQLFGFRNLHVFKQKFRPRWAPVYFAASPRLGVFELYAGCRMWGLY